MTPARISVRRLVPRARELEAPFEQARGFGFGFGFRQAASPLFSRSIARGDGNGRPPGGSLQHRIPINRR